MCEGWICSQPTNRNINMLGSQYILHLLFFADLSWSSTEPDYESERPSRAAETCCGAETAPPRLLLSKKRSRCAVGRSGKSSHSPSRSLLFQLFQRCTPLLLSSRIRTSDPPPPHQTPAQNTQHTRVGTDNTDNNHIPRKNHPGQEPPCTPRVRWANCPWITRRRSRIGSRVGTR